MKTKKSKGTKGKKFSPPSIKLKQYVPEFVNAKRLVKRREEGNATHRAPKRRNRSAGRGGGE